MTNWLEDLIASIGSARSTGRRRRTRSAIRRHPATDVSGRQINAETLEPRLLLSAANPLQLSDLDGSNGFVINGIDAVDGSGRSVSSAGDVNGDGFDDLVIGAVDADPNGNSNAGESYVVFGKSDGFASSVSLSNLDGSNGFVINGIDAGDRSGFSVSSAGDVNGDGFDDLVIGAASADPNGNSGAGESYVVFGKSGGFASSLNLSSLDGSNGFVINGIDESDLSGSSVSSAGDVNGDGFDDLGIGARWGDANGNSFAGESYVVFGKSADFASSLNLRSLDGSNGFIINGIDARDYSGSSVSSASDVNGDGFDDLVIGARGGDPNGNSLAGESYVVFGKSGGFTSNINLRNLDGSNGFVINGIDAGDASGSSVSSAGDVNGDGFDDLIIGANLAGPDGNFNSGESYVVFGGNFTDGVGTQVGTEVADVLTANQGSTAVDVLIGGRGDDVLISDGGADVLIGGLGNDVLSLIDVDFSSTRRLTGGNGTDTLRLTGTNQHLDLTSIADNRIIDIERIDITGGGNNRLTLDVLELLNISSHSNTLIVRGDETAVLTVDSGQWSRGDQETIDGELFDVFTNGAATLKASSEITTFARLDLSILNLSILNGRNGFVINGINADDYSSFSVSGAGDVNGDGFDDFIIGAPLADEAGQSYVLFGKADGFSSSVNLSNLDGSNGFVIDGIDPEDRSGSSVSSAGDFNGDGFDDLIFGAPSGGESYVVFGKSGNFASSVKLGDLDGSNGFVINGAQSGDQSGVSVSHAGDVNGDGFDDLAIGAVGADPNGNSNAGESYIVFGKSGGFASNVNLSDLKGSNNFVINGIDAGDFSGNSVSSAGDVNGDGFGRGDDILISDGGADVLIGGSGNDVLSLIDVDFSSTRRLTGGNGTDTLRLTGTNQHLDLTSIADNRIIDIERIDITGGNNRLTLDALELLNISSHSNTLIVRGDATAVVAVDLSEWSRGDQKTIDDELFDVFTNGAATLKASAGITAITTINFDLSTLNGSNGFVINGIDALDGSGTSVSSAGDVNGDGFDDVIIAAVGADPIGGSLAGESYVVFGKADGFSSSVNLSDLDGSNGFVINGIDAGDRSGTSVSSAGDVNGDGFDDLVIGAIGGSPSAMLAAGESYVVFGKSAGFASSLNLSDLDGSNGFVINGIDAGDRSGFSVSSAGDVNGDGFDDLVIGAASADANGYFNAGESYVVFGKSDGFASSLNLSDLDGSNGFLINGIDTGDASGFSVSSAGDVNGDGFHDLIIGAPSAGESYVVFGKSDGFSSSVNLSDLAGSDGFVLNGIDELDRSGRSVSSAGDVNGDGFDDLVIGATGGAPTGRYGTGESYVVFGGNFTGGVGTQVGSGLADVLTANQGSTAVDVLIGGGGDDILVSDGGADVLIGGSGNDVLSLIDVDFSSTRRLTGGSGTDTLTLTGTNQHLDLTTIADNRIIDIERIDIRGAGENALTLNHLEVLNISSNTLIIRRGSGDTVNIGAGWNAAADDIIDGNKFAIFTQGAATLKIESAAIDLSVSSTSGTEANQTVITITATAASAVVGDQTVDLVVTGAGITSDDFALSGTSITIPDGQTTGTQTFTVVNDTLAEALSETATLTLSNPSAGLALGTTVSLNVTITDDDDLTPILTTTTTSSNNLVTVPITVDFGQPVTGFSVEDLSTEGTGTATISDFTDSGDGQFSFNLNPTTDGTITVNIAAEAADDVGGKPTLAATPLSITSDRTDPGVAITSDTTEAANDDFVLTFTFTEVVTGFTADDVVLSGGTKGLFSGSENQYTLVVIPPDNSTTTITVDIAANVSEDTVGNGNSAAEQFRQEVDTTPVDTTPPKATVRPLPLSTTTDTILLSIDVNDEAGAGGDPPSGVASYDLYVALDDGDWTLLHDDLPGSQTTVTVPVESNTRYWFRAVATDNAGNTEVESTTPAPETNTYVGDVDGPDTSVVSATVDSATGVFTLNLSGTDAGNSGVSIFRVFVSVDGAAAVEVPLSSIVAGTPDSGGVYTASTTYQGIRDGASHTYTFYSIGIDGSGNIEQPPVAATADVQQTHTFASPVAALAATGIDVQNGATQRSYVRHVDVLFDDINGLQDLIDNDRFQVEKFALNDATPDQGTGTAVAVSGASIDGNGVKLDFGADGIGGAGNSGNGFYRIALDLDGDGIFDDAHFEFFRLWADNNGDGAITSADRRVTEDLNGDGFINALDRSYFRRERGKSLLQLLFPELDD